MQRTTGFSVAALVLACPCPALAADEDVQLWVSQSVTTPVGDTVDGTVDLSQRIRESGNQLLTRGTVEVRLWENAVLGGGAAYVVTDDAADEVRPHQQLTLTFGPLALRTRVEERFFDGADRMELRLREKVTATWPVTPRLKAALAGELLYTAQSRDFRRGDHVDQWRANATLTHRLTDSLESTLGYLAILAPGGGAPDKLSHVIQLSLTYRR